MMATVPHVTSGLGLRKFQAGGFLLTRVYLRWNFHTLKSNGIRKVKYVTLSHLTVRTVEFKTRVSIPVGTECSCCGARRWAICSRG